MFTADRPRLPAPPEPVAGRVAVVGVCGAGKSTLVDRLLALGYDARQSSQEHSYVPDMWQRLARPQVLVYLDASREAVEQRLQKEVGQVYWREQCRRLEHARQHCHIYVDTTSLSGQEVLDRVLQGLERLGIRPIACRHG